MAQFTVTDIEVEVNNEYYDVTLEVEVDVVHIEGRLPTLTDPGCADVRTLAVKKVKVVEVDGETPDAALKTDCEAALSDPLLQQLVFDMIWVLHEEEMEADLGN